MPHILWIVSGSMSRARQMSCGITSKYYVGPQSSCGCTTKARSYRRRGLNIGASISLLCNQPLVLTVVARQVVKH